MNSQNTKYGCVVCTVTFRGVVSKSVPPSTFVSPCLDLNPTLAISPTTNLWDTEPNLSPNPSHGVHGYECEYLKLYRISEAYINSLEFQKSDNNIYWP